MKTKKIFTTLSVTLCTASLATAFSALPIQAKAQGVTVIIDTNEEVTLLDNNKNGYYDIATANDLYAFASAINNGSSMLTAELVDNIVVNENVLTPSGELNGDGSSFRVWEPIGFDPLSGFAGEIKGNGKTISGLYYSGDQPSVGLVAFTEDRVKITNLGVEDSYFYSTFKYEEEETGIGGIVGHCGKNNLIENCHFQGVLSGQNFFNVGGICGKLNNNGLIKNCYTLGNIRGDETVGGVVGYAYYSNVQSSYYIGKLKANSGKGGVSGQLYTASIEKCYAIGEKDEYLKLTGRNFYNTISDCYYQASKEMDTSEQTTFKTYEQIMNGELCEGIGFHAYHVQETPCGTACGLCSTLLVEEPNHVWNEGEVTKEPTTSETGIKTYTCSNGIHTKTEEIPILEEVPVVEESPSGCAASVTGIALIPLMGIAAFVLGKKKD